MRGLDIVFWCFATGCGSLAGLGLRLRMFGMLVLVRGFVLLLVLCVAPITVCILCGLLLICLLGWLVGYYYVDYYN